MPLPGTITGGGGMGKGRGALARRRGRDLARENSLAEFLSAVFGAEGPVRLSGLAGAGAAYLAARALSDSRFAGVSPLLVVFPDAAPAASFARDLRFFAGEARIRGAASRILYLPPWEILPYDRLSPHRGTSFERLAALGRLSVPPPTPEGPDGGVLALVTDARSLAQRVMAPEVLREAAFDLEVGGEIDRDALLERLVTIGYSSGPLAETRGEFSARGGLVDVFPIDGAVPLRIELDGDRIERIRCYDPETQRSVSERTRAGGEMPLQRVRILPAREIILDRHIFARSKEAVRARLAELGFPLEQRVELLSDLERGIYHPGVEFLLPLLEPAPVPLTAYLGPRFLAWLVEKDEIVAALDSFHKEIARGLKRTRESRHLHVEPGTLWRRAQEVLSELPRNRVEIAALQLDESALAAEGEGKPPSLRLSFEGNQDLRSGLEEGSAKQHPLSPLVHAIEAWRGEGHSVFLVCGSTGSGDRLQRLLESYGIVLPLWTEGSPEGIVPRGSPDAGALTAPRAGIIVGEISSGFHLPQERIAFVTEAEIFGPRRRLRGRAARRKEVAETFTARLEDLKPGDHLVHRDHGVARYHGLVHLVVGEEEGDFLQLEFAGQDRLYLPVRRVHLVQRYVGADDATPRLDRLGGATWGRAKGKAAQAVRAMARELLEVHAARQVMRRKPLSQSAEGWEQFEARFPYEETPDQLSAIEETLADLRKPHPMDRLVCGDVGYGKTEIAMRAAFQVVSEGKQVAMLVPTTVLALQHYQTFSERFRDYPVIIEELSRFKSPRKQREIISRLAEGKVDIVVGTHRLLGKDVSYKNLGLFVIDEEQRFGVRHKEQVKQMRKLVDVLTLTATPIPRTLHMGLLGLRDLSVINTPPEDRLAIRTFVMHWDGAEAAEAIRRELARGGQVFFVHNRVRTIAETADMVKQLVPEAKIVVAHGRMRERDLESVMLAFQKGAADVLVSTSIIENGLDLPNVNTLLVDRADRFGLAQLYQMRGRVGRSAIRAYAYLFIPRAGSLSRDARKRLAALQDLVELGSAFKLAAHDLEIRGAGNLLGANQSGHIAAVGYEMFTELLERAIREIRGQPLEEEIDVEIDLKIPAFIPEGFVTDTSQRLAIYRRLSLARSDEDVADVEWDVRDRYGALPDEARYLIEAVRVRLLARALRVKAIERMQRELLITWSDPACVDPDRVLAVVAESKGEIRLLPDNRLRLYMAGKSPKTVLESARKVLQSLG